jgi:hypothetical protein
MDSLVSQPTLGHIKCVLQNLPQGMKGLDETYSQAMRRIEGQEEGYRELAKQILAWITHAKRALSTVEIQHALAVHPDKGELDEDFLPEIEILSSVCFGLTTVDENSDIVRLVYYTTQDFFERTNSFPNAHRDITATCVTYLSFDTFATGFCPTNEEFEARLQLNPLYDYAARNWGHHAREAWVEPEQLIQFLECEAKVSASSQAMMASREYFGYNNTRHVPRQMTGVHLAAYFGLSAIITTFLINGQDLDVRDSYKRTPLSWAAENGHETVVRLLLDQEGMHVDVWGWSQLTPLSYAAQNGHEAVVKLL